MSDPEWERVTGIPLHKAHRNRATAQSKTNGRVFSEAPVEEIPDPGYKIRLLTEEEREARRLEREELEEDHRQFEKYQRSRRASLKAKSPKRAYAYQEWLKQVGLFHGYDVYWIYQGDLLLYVGMTGNLYQRLQQHWSEKPEIRAATHVKTITMATRKEAAKIETEAIRTDEPLLNRQRR